MATPVKAAQGADLMVNIFDGRRQPMLPNSDLLYRIIDGNQKSIVTRNAKGSSLFAEGLPFYDNFGDNYTVIVSGDGWFQAGFFPVHVSNVRLTNLDLMLIPKKSRLDFDDASWDKLQQAQPAVWQLLAAGAPPGDGQARYKQLMSSRPLSLASFLNLTTAMGQINLPVGTPLQYFRLLKWDDSFQQDRFFAYADKKLINQVRTATAQGMFAPEIGTGFFHPGATSSYKQIQFGEANVQLTFHEGDLQTINGTDCVLVEPDIDYYKDAGGHSLLEVLSNKVTGGLTDPRTVYVLRWIAGRHAGIPEFAPPYTIEVAS